MRYKDKPKNIFKKISNFQLLIITLIILLLTISAPTLARFKNRVINIPISVWDGSLATKYYSGTGSQNDPYIISNGSELAFFQTQLESDKYLNKHFKLSNDIILNTGKFEYTKTEGPMYILNQITYYIDEYTNKYYDNIDRTGTEVGTVNDIASLDGFEGYLSGESYRIKGLYIKSDINEELALFTDLKGTLADIYIENSIVYGGRITGGLVANATAAEISNVFYDGYVIGKATNLSKTIEITPTINAIDINTTESTDYFNLTNETPFVGSLINTTTLTGNYTITGATDAQTTIKINDEIISGGSFNIDLGTAILSEVEVKTSTTVIGDVSLSFSNLAYNIDYDYGVAGGIIASANGCLLENVINKAFVSGYSTAGGLIGVTTKETTINRAYNKGQINSDKVAGGLIGTIEKNTALTGINKAYNTADIVAPEIGGVIGYIKNNSGTISINNVFNTSLTDYSIGTIINSTVNVNNAFYVNGPSAVKSGAISGNFALTTMSNLYSKTYIETNLLFSEFQSLTDVISNIENVWVFDKDSLPILFIDDLNNPIATISASTYNWNNLSYNLKDIYLKSSTAFIIEENNALRPFKEVYYYINHSNIALTETELTQVSWTSYTDIVQINQEGTYIIYAKIVDNSDDIYYLNSDILILDWTKPTGIITYKDTTWNTLKTTLDNIYVDRSFNLGASVADTLSGVKSFDYYLTNTPLTETALNELDSSKWIAYENEISITQRSTTIIYVRILDKSGNKRYINSDYIIYEGYNQNAFYVGKNNNTYPSAELYITNKSSFSFNTTYEKINTELSNHSHNLITTKLLPLNTNIYIKDNKLKKVYTYKIPTASDIYNYNDSCNGQGTECINQATYPFSLFKEIGVGSQPKPFVENSYYNNGTTSEDFTITIDFSETNFSQNHIDLYTFLELHDGTGKNVRPTLYDTLKTINIYSTTSSQTSAAKLSLETTYTGGTIDYNSDSNISIPLNSKLIYKKDTTHTITDTTFENKEIGVVIKMEDTDGNIINSQNLDNFVFKIDNNIYYPGDDGLIRIGFKNGIVDSLKNLSITTYKNNNLLKDGTYYFKIMSYSAYDGLYYDELNSEEISIPVNVSKPYSGDDYSFSVESDVDYRLINKKETNVAIVFNILQTGIFENPNIRISLYEKDQLTAYNQDYSLVNLNNYITNTLTNYNGFVYYVSSNPQELNVLNLNLKTNSFNNNGYKFLFELYDGNKLICPLEKYFIVR